MAKATPTPTTRNESMMLVASFFIVLFVNAVVIYFANMLFPQHVVLGTMSLSLWWALIISSSVISLATVFSMPFINHVETTRQKLWSPAELMGMYFVINFFIIWLLGRVSEVFGLGVSSWLVVLVLAIILDFLQGTVMMMVEKMRN